jgi:hypothetical protein
MAQAEHRPLFLEFLTENIHFVLFQVDDRMSEIIFVIFVERKSISGIDEKDFKSLLNLIMTKPVAVFSTKKGLKTRIAIPQRITPAKRNFSKNI